MSFAGFVIGLAYSVIGATVFVFSGKDPLIFAGLALGALGLGGVLAATGF